MWKRIIGKPRREIVIRDDIRVGSKFFITAICECGERREPQCSADGVPYPQSCGCLQRQRAVEVHTTHGGSDTRLYRIYKGLFARCYNPNDTSYPRYGGRGITVAKKWATFEAFREWAESHGYADDLSIHRINNDGPYSPRNCEWATAKKQLRNTSRNRKLTAWGETKTLAEWAEDPRCTVRQKTLFSRLKYGWEPEMVLTAPIGTRPYGRSPNGTYRQADTVNRVKSK